MERFLVSQLAADYCWITKYFMFSEFEFIPTRSRKHGDHKSERESGKVFTLTYVLNDMVC